MDGILNRDPQLDLFLADLELRCLPIYQALWEASPSASKSVRTAYESAIRTAYERGYVAALRESGAGHRGKLYKDNHYALPEGA